MPQVAGSGTALACSDRDASAERASAGIVAVDGQRVLRRIQRDRIRQPPELVDPVVKISTRL